MPPISRYLLFGVLAIPWPVLAQETNAAIVPGKSVSIPWEGLHHKKFSVFVPKDWTPNRKWPTIVYYPGVFGSPNTRVMEDFTHQKDWVIISLSGITNDVFDYNEALVRKELAVCQSIIKAMTPKLNLDPERLVISGYSKGGWIATMFVDRDHSFSGAVVMGAGANLNQKYTPKRFAKPTSIYIGVGQEDGNYVFSLRAKPYWRKLGARVTFDEYPGMGHDGPPFRKDLRGYLEQWLRIAAGMEDKASATNWLREQLAALKKEDDLLKRYLAYEKLLEAPFLHLVDENVRKHIDGQLTALRKLPALATEWKAEQVYRNIMRREVKVTSLKQLRSCQQAFDKLAKSYPDTHYGQRARKDVPRVGTMLPASQ